MNNYRIPKLSSKNASTSSSTDVSIASNSPRGLSLEGYLQRKNNLDKPSENEQQLLDFVDKKIDNQIVKEIDKESIIFLHNKTLNNLLTDDEKISSKSKTLKKPSSSSSSRSHKKSSDDSKKSSSKHHSRGPKDEKKSNDSSSHKHKKSKRRRDSPSGDPDGKNKIITDDSTETPPKKRRDSSPEKSSSKTKKSSSSKDNRSSSSKNEVEDDKISTENNNRCSTQIGTSKTPRVSRVLDDKKSSHVSPSHEKQKTESSSSKKSTHKNDTSSRSKKSDETKNGKKREHEKSSGDYLQKMKRRYQREQEEIDKKQDENMNIKVKPKVPIKEKAVIKKIIPEPVEDLSSIYEDVFVPLEISQQLDQQINLSRVIQFDSGPIVPVFSQPPPSRKEDEVNVPQPSSRDPRFKSNCHNLVERQINTADVSQSLLAGNCLEDSPGVIHEPGLVDEADDYEAGWSASSLHHHGSISSGDAAATMPFECATGMQHQLIEQQQQQQQMQLTPLHCHQIQQVPLFHQIQLQHQPPELTEEFIVPTELPETFQSSVETMDQTAEFIIPEMITTCDIDQTIQEENSQSIGVVENSQSTEVVNRIQTIRLRNLTDLVAEFEKVKITQVPEILDNLNEADLPIECYQNVNLNDIFKDFAHVMQLLIHNERVFNDDLFETNGEIIGRKKKLISKYLEPGLKMTDGNLDKFVELFNKYLKKSEMPYRFDENYILDIAKGVLDISAFF